MTLGYLCLPLSPFSHPRFLSLAMSAVPSRLVYAVTRIPRLSLLRITRFFSLGRNSHSLASPRGFTRLFTYRTREFAVRRWRFKCCFNHGRWLFLKRDAKTQSRLSPLLLLAWARRYNYSSDVWKRRKYRVLCE